MLTSKQLLSGLALSVSLMLLGASSSTAWAAPEGQQQQPEVLAQRGDRGNRNEPGGRRGRFLEQLNLSEAQMQEIQAIRESYAPEMRELGEQMRTERQELRQLMVGNADDGEIRSQHDRVLDLHQSMAEMRFESMLEIRNVLTPEQRQEWSELVEQRRDEFGGDRGRGEGRGPRR